MGLIRGSYKWNGIRHELYEPLSILCTNNESRGGDTQQRFIRGGSSPSFNLLPFYIPFLSEKVSLSYTFY